MKLPRRKKCARCGTRPRWGRNVYCKRCVREVTALNPRQK